ncbi:hypothetical protein ACXZ26_004985 [Escherichia coli]
MVKLALQPGASVARIA